MSAPTLSEIIRSYLDYILSPDRITEPSEIKTPALLHLLDELALHSHDMSGVFAYEEDPTPVYVYDSLHKTLALHFSDYGYYSTVRDISPHVLTDNHGLGDAIDDMADIALDLSNALQIADTHGEAAGQYDFVASYRIHWGVHLRELQRYLHWQMTGF